MRGLIPFILFLPFLLNAQNYLMNGAPIAACGGTFYDSGGPAGDYANNQQLTTTICSDGSGGTHVRLSFSGADLGPGDALCFYDGPTAAAPLLSCASDYPVGQPFVIQATAANPSGCITVTFQSNGSGTASGWAAAISCVASCQTVLANLVSTTPAVTPVDTGWIDICPGERVFFTGSGAYPQNNYAYSQSDLTTTFEWNFGDGGIAYGPATSHRFNTPGGYFVQLQLTDTMGCRSTNLISQRIRVAQRPDFEVFAPGQICAGDTLHLSAQVGTTDPNKTVSATPQTVSFASEASRSDSLPLPDGTGELYETGILLTQFSPGQVMTSENDLESICVTIEHSWMRDIEITLTCPSGQTIILHDHPGNFGGEVHLGEPNDNDNFNPIPGVGYEYCWVPNAPNPTWLDYANNVLGGSGTLPAGEYSSYEPISDLVGCPLNGEWTIGVTDLWPSDNGFIFNWSIKFKESLYPNIETFTPGFANWGWNNPPTVFYSDADSIAATPHNAGTAGYTFHIDDSFGCTWDTLVSIPVLPPTHPNCYVCDNLYPPLLDTTVCPGAIVNLNGISQAPSKQEVRFEAFPDYRIGNANHPPSNPYLSPISVSSLGFNFLSVPIQQITSVCLDIETDYDADLNIFLRAPSGQQLMLSTGNGGSGDNYKVTCFSPTASVPVVGQSAPFNGTYVPEGNWNALAGSAVNGDWSLVVSDAFAPAQYGKVNWWSIGFNAQNTVNYSWTNNASLSCGACGNPQAIPATSTDYILTATDSHNCIHRDTASITVNNFFPAPGGLLVFELGTGTMTWRWDPVPTALGYEVSVDGGPWQAPNNGALSQIVTGLSVGQSVQMAVRCISPNTCVPDVASKTSVFPACNMYADIFSITGVPCASDTTGSAIFSVSNANPPVLFYLDNNPVPYPNGDLIKILSGGPHSVIVLDGLGCRDTVNFSVPAPPPINLSVSGIDVKCNGDNSGVVSALAFGGTGTLSFVWRNCLGGNNLAGAVQNNLYAGCYQVTVTDANSCTATAVQNITEPPPFQFIGVQDSVSCNGLSDGSATMTVSGGLIPYAYQWDSGATTSTANSLSAGFHFVTITDANLCAATTFVEVLEPPLFFLDSTHAHFVTCFGGNNGMASVYVSGGEMPYQYLWDDPAGQKTQKAQTLSAGLYHVTVTDNNGCLVMGSATVSTPPDIQITFSNVSNEICAGDCQGEASVAAMGGVGGFQYSWSSPTIPSGAQQVTNLCPGIYQVTVQDANGCTVSDNVSIAPAIQIDVQFNNASPTCSGFQNGTIDATVSGGSTPYQYLWSNGATSAQLQNLACGTYTLTLTDAVGCVKQFSTEVICPQTLIIDSVFTQAAACFNQPSGAAGIAISGGTNPLSYFWSDSQGQITAVAQNLKAGAYTVTVSDAMGCSTTASASVGQPTALVVNINHTDVSCLNFSDGSATATGSGGVAPYQYSWGAAGTGQTIQHLAAGTFFVTVTDANACTSTASVTINQPTSAITVNASQTRRACFGEQDGQASVSASGSNGVPFNFAWSNGQTGGGASGLATGLYTVTATDAKGCTATQVVAIQELDSIIVKVAYAPPTCDGDSNGLVAVVLIQGGLGMGDSTQYDYHWSLPGAQDFTVATGFAAGNYSLTVSDLQGCTGQINFEVVGPPAIKIGLDVKDVVCFGEQNGSVTVNSVQNAVGAVQYQWSNNASANFIDNLPAGNYSLTLSDSKGCTATSQATVSQPDLLTLKFQTRELLCAYDSNALIHTQVNGGIPGYQYHWSNGSTTDSLSHLGPGLYVLEVRDQNNCLSLDSVNIEQPNAMVVQLADTPPDCFGGQDGRIKMNISGGKTPYRYRIDDEPFGGSSVFIALSAGIYQLHAIDANGCTVSISDTLDQPVPIVVSAGIDTTIILGDSLLLTANVNNAFGMTTLAWSSVLVDSIQCVDMPDCETVVVKPPFSNTYRLKVTDEKGCMGKAEVRITVDKPRGVYVPTGFTPNGDFENDLLLVHGKSKQVKEVLMFKIFDRWGELLYEDQHFPVNMNNRGWDGNFRGKPCDPGVYVWMLEAEYLDGHRELLKGDVTLLR